MTARLMIPARAALLAASLAGLVACSGPEKADEAAKPVALVTTAVLQRARGVQVQVGQRLRGLCRYLDARRPGQSLHPILSVRHSGTHNSTVHHTHEHHIHVPPSTCQCVVRAWLVIYKLCM